MYSRLHALRYTIAFTGPVLAVIGLLSHGLRCWALPLYAFVLVPLVELFTRPLRDGFTADAERAAANDPLFDVLLLLFVPVQWGVLILFLFCVRSTPWPSWDLAGKVATMGLMCGVYGINIAHELGHRATRWERDLARLLLLSSLYMHFIIEHNRGHHRRVGTPEDPASARFGESIYRFWPRTIVFSLISAWNIEVVRLRRKGLPAFGVANEMIRALLIQSALVACIALAFGPMALLGFLAAALIGVLLLETVNYIEHYGLGRPVNERGVHGRVQHVHSWNSDHLIGRCMLFELTRHSDHHFMASRKYQVLRSVPEAPELPTGYPGMMLLSLVPPLWFRVVDPIVRRLVGTHTTLIFATGAAKRPA